jgi:uncharacterized protein YdbL (DUF1318 family)
MRKILPFFVLFALYCIPSLPANNAETIKQNMLKRRPRIQELKREGLIGENHEGYLAVVDKSLPAADKNILDDENKDRKEVYEAIAKQQGSNARTVGQLRAKRIFEQARSGEYLKSEGGSWKQK